MSAMLKACALIVGPVRCRHIPIVSRVCRAVASPSSANRQAYGDVERANARSKPRYRGLRHGIAASDMLTKAEADGQETFVCSRRAPVSSISSGLHGSWRRTQPFSVPPASTFNNAALPFSATVELRTKMRFES